MDSMHQASIAARAAINSLHAVSVICNDLIPFSQPMTKEQQRDRATLIHSVLQARKRVMLIRDRAEALSGALARFRDRREQIANRA